MKSPDYIDPINEAVILVNDRSLHPMHIEREENDGKNNYQCFEGRRASISGIWSLFNGKQ